MSEITRLDEISRLYSSGHDVAGVRIRRRAGEVGMNAFGFNERWRVEDDAGELRGCQEGHAITALDQLVGMHVLFLNWRDTSHPQAGGAEAYCHEIARRWAAAGVQVTLFASRYPGADVRSSSDGVSIRRCGGTFGVYPAAAAHVRRNRRDYDAVVDFQNGIPFFSPLFLGRCRASISVIHHVHREQFDLRFRWPMNSLGRALEKQASRLVYRGRPIVVVSPSTREEVRRGLGFRNPIYLVPNGATPRGAVLVPRSASPTIAVVNRLVPHKRIDLLLRAVPALVRRWPDLRVDIAGDGSERLALQNLAADLGLDHVVEFHGRVDERRKNELLARSWLAVVPSRAEGWGLAVTDANTVGTPALAFDVPGLRDAIEDCRNGWLLPAGTDLAEGIAEAIEELSVSGAAVAMADRCRTWASSFSWDDSAVRLAEVVLAELRRIQRRRRSRRRVTDLAVVAQFEAADADALERMMSTLLRRTDTRIRRENSFQVRLHGCDEVLALQVLGRLGVYDARITLARRRDEIRGLHIRDAMRLELPARPPAPIPLILASPNGDQSAAREVAWENVEAGSRTNGQPDDARRDSPPEPPEAPSGARP